MGDRTRRALPALLSLSLMIGMAMMLPTRSASADTQYNASGDMGRTYQNNWNSSCTWWDGGTSPRPCYKGVWSDTVTWTWAETAQVSEWANHHYNFCVGEYCQPSWSDFGDQPSTVIGAYEAATNHYYSGWLGQSVQVRGWARHWNLSLSDSFWWTTSDGY